MKRDRIGLIKTFKTTIKFLNVCVCVHVWVEGVKTEDCDDNGLELLEFLAGTRSLGHFEDIESDGLRQWPALSNSHDVTKSDVSVEKKKYGKS